MRIANTFCSLQGEGDLSGVPMFFVRTSGCSVSHCPLHPFTGGVCDTDWSYKASVEVDELSRLAKDSGMHWVCITGGEPTDQLKSIVDLAAECHKNNQRVMLQTSGVREVPDCWDWLVVSPKNHFLLNQQKSGHELKFVWKGEDFGYLDAMASQTRFLRYFLQPLWNKDGTTNIDKVADVVLKCGQRGMPYRLGIQQHKIWGGE